MHIQRVSVYFLISILKFGFILNSATSEDILGCGGFIKSHADIDFSKIYIKLLTKQGSLKDKIDCSPSNGYYFIPIYDVGEYVLKISPPPGWSFEPHEIEINFDGKTDVCSQGKDVNFVFKGFGITGKVGLAGQKTGAQDVTVELTSQDGKTVRTTNTDVGGLFSFTPVIPGTYKLKASHSRWHFQKSEISVVVEGANTEIPENALMVSGFDVNGVVENEGYSGKIGIALYGLQGSNLPADCRDRLPAFVKQSNVNGFSGPICYTSVSQKGDFVVKALPPGKYLAKPIVENQSISLRFEPATIQFEVSKDTEILPTHFVITGFAASGRVLAKKGGNGIVGAKVTLDGTLKAVTKDEGVFNLDSITPGTHTLNVKYDDIEFEDKVIAMDLSTPTLPDIYPSKYKICGKVVSEKSYVVSITKQGSTFHTTSASNPDSGSWCTFVPAGIYTIQVIPTELDKNSGIQFYPSQQNVEVHSGPVRDIVFSQLRALLSGEIVCLSDTLCKSSKVILQSLDVNGNPIGEAKFAVAEGGKYAFEDILPGPYEVMISPSNICFDKRTNRIEVNTAVVKAPSFVQKGYEITIISSHWTEMVYTHVMKESDQGTNKPEKRKIMSGVNTFCVPRAGDYKIVLEGCHLYDESLPKTISTYDPNPIVFTAVAHKVGVRVLSPENDSKSIMLTLTQDSDEKNHVTLIPESEKVDGFYSYRYDVYLRPNEVVNVKPESNLLLFKPQSRDIQGSNDCIDVAFSFIASKGVTIRGNTQPPISGVKVTITFPNNPELSQQETVTSSSGSFQFGPIDSTTHYELTAEKESYEFGSYDKSTATFSAHKLCDIIVNVNDESGKKLPGVLLSLSGSVSYRKNMVTGNDGSIKFHSLSPNQYFLRPMLKEYVFTPSSKIIDLNNGETVTVELIGKRVALSAFGKVTSLNGESFPNVNLEAVSDEKCAYHQEEVTSEKNGQFRIRGLQPGCTYTVGPKKVDNRFNLEKTIPNTKIIQVGTEDVQDVNLIGISSFEFVDVNVRVIASNNDHYKHLRIELYCKGGSDAPLFSERVENHFDSRSKHNFGTVVCIPRIPLDGKTCTIDLKSTLSETLYSYQVPSVSFVADKASVAVELEFNPEIRSVDVELTKKSLSTLFLVFLVAFVFLKPDSVSKLFAIIYKKAHVTISQYF